MTPKHDESGIIMSWFIKVALLLAVIGVIGFDVGSMLVNAVTLDSSAKDVAISVSIDVAVLPGASSAVSDPQIYQMAVDYVKDEANGITSARVVKKGTEVDDAGVVHIRLRRKAHTLVTHFIGPLKKFTVSTADGQAGTD